LPEDEPYHTVEFTVGIKATRNKDGTIRSVKGSQLWQGLPNHVTRDERLLHVKVEVPESFFAVSAKVKGKIESRLQEEYVSLIEELESDPEEKTP